MVHKKASTPGHFCFCLPSQTIRGLHLVARSGCNLRDTAIGYKELIGGSEAFDKVIKVIEDVMDKELMKEFDGNNPLLDYDPFISDPHRSRISHQ